MTQQKIQQLNSHIEDVFWTTLENLLAEDVFNEEVFNGLKDEIVSYHKQRIALGDE